MISKTSLIWINIALFLTLFLTVPAKATEKIEADKVSNLLELYFEKKVDFKYRVIHTPKKIHTCPAEKTLVSKTISRPSSRWIMKLHCEPTGKRQNIVISIKKRYTTYTSTRKILKGETLTVDNIKKSNFWSGSYKKSPNLVPYGYIAKKNIPPRIKITENYMSENFLINLGDLVSVELKSDGLTIKVAAISSGSANLGGTIELSNINTGKIFNAIVVGPGNASYY